MKHFFILIILFIAFSVFITGCEPFKQLKIETLAPAEIDFPGNFNKILFVNLDTDINNDGENDTILYNLITKEMNLGFIEAINSNSVINTSDLISIKEIPDRDKVYRLDTISWSYIEMLAGTSNSDIVVFLDSVSLSMKNESFVDHYSYPIVYYKYREVYVSVNWSVFDLIEKKRLDQYRYNDTLYWEASGYSKQQAKKELPSMERSLRELSFFSALDYGNRIFPGWESEVRIYYQGGNKDFKNAALLVENDENWEEASHLWENHVNSYDKEIASRACFNLALASEMLGDFGVAIKWAEKSNSIKEKTRTKYYITVLKARQKELKKLQKQL
ncbi:MAG: hypothetical protein JEY96_04450 [Bacteroidales bacterium]|nr:hypothetical protein [Bacteroidales bacterium]